MYTTDCLLILASKADMAVMSVMSVMSDAFKRVTAGASADDKRALFSDTARRAYRLP